MKKLKLFPSVLMLALCIGILGIGIYAATPTNNVITGTITVNAANAGITVEVFKGTNTSVAPIGSDTGRTQTEIALTGDNAIKIDASEAESLSEVEPAVYTIRLKTTSNIKLVVDTETIEWLDGTTTTGTITDALKITKVHAPAATDTSTGLAYFNNDAGAYEIVCSINLTDLHEEDFTSELNMVINVHKLEDWVEMGNTGINGIDYLHLGEYPQAKSAETTGFGEAVGAFGAYNDAATKTSEIETTRNVYVKDGKRYVEMDGSYYEIQPLKWRILSTTNGYSLMCDTIIEQVYYQEFCKYKNGAYYATIDGVTSETIYANNYYHSTLRKFLNEIFYESAFSDAERALIQKTIVKNDDASMGGTDTKNYSCEDTEDWVYALSYQDLQGYDFGTAEFSSARQVKPSDYGVDTGVSVYYTSEDDILSGCGWESKGDAIEGIKGWNEDDNLTDAEAEKIYYGMIKTGYWWLRSPHGDSDNSARGVADCGDVSGSRVTYDWLGCVPALLLGL